MIVVIQCASGKQANAGSLKTKDGRSVLFVGDPKAAPPSGEIVYARPDDLSGEGVSWRELLLNYNRTPSNNPLGLYPAWELYTHPTYGRLVNRFGAESTYILSAGWGLISSSFLTPDYDVTFSQLKPDDRYKVRKKNDSYKDIDMLQDKGHETFFFFGGRNYVPLFCELTKSASGVRTVFFNSQEMPDAPGCLLKRFVTKTRTNWHYECANAFIDGEIG